MADDSPSPTIMVGTEQLVKWNHDSLTHKSLREEARRELHRRRIGRIEMEWSLTEPNLEAAYPGATMAWDRDVDFGERFELRSDVAEVLAARPQDRRQLFASSSIDQFFPRTNSVGLDMLPMSDKEHCQIAIARVLGHSMFARANLEVRSTMLYLIASRARELCIEIGSFIKMWPRDIPVTVALTAHKDHGVAWTTETSILYDERTAAWRIANGDSVGRYIEGRIVDVLSREMHFLHGAPMIGAMLPTTQLDALKPAGHEWHLVVIHDRAMTSAVPRPAPVSSELVRHVGYHSGKNIEHARASAIAMLARQEGR